MNFLEVNKEKIEYTKKHRDAFMKCVLSIDFEDEAEKKVMINRAHKHDKDKLTLYTLMSVKDAHKLHRAKSTHHVNDLPKSRYDYMEMIIDWECARFTKADKQLSARQWMNKAHPEMHDVLDPIMKELGL